MYCVLADMSSVVAKSLGLFRLDHVVKVVREGQTKRAPIERVADLVTAYFVPVITLLAALTWVIWLCKYDWLDMHDGS
jgi:cation transport ATPase